MCLSMCVLDDKKVFSAKKCCVFLFRTFMNTGKQQKPVLTGQRFKTRKRGKYLRQLFVAACSLFTRHVGKETNVLLCCNAMLQRY